MSQQHDDVSGVISVSGITSVGGIILAGGSSSRLGQNKALLQVEGLSLIERVRDRLRLVVSAIVLVTNTPSELAYLGLPMTTDIYPGVGVLGGLHAGLSAIGTDYGLVVGCDMPLLNPGLLRYMISQREGYDVVMPRVGKYHEPLHAIYSRHCLPAIEKSIVAGRRRIMHACAEMRIRYVDSDEIAAYDPEHTSFFNVNTPDDLARLTALLRRT
jgi:molybdopterin-guanine dinucleotide biosynthesis protein A